jgi:hypothetical protein
VHRQFTHEKDHCCCRVYCCRYMTLETRKDGTKFTSRALKQAAERQAELAGRYEGLQKDLVAQVRRPASVDCDVLCVGGSAAVRPAEGFGRLVGAAERCR